jgi:anthraniloyl-CoA monooxygenase
MKITVIGGGPGGLYFSILCKKARPDWDITIFEQNRPDDTFGFGVVFSDDTLEEFLSRDPESYDMIRDNFAYWDDILIRYKGEELRCGGNGFAGCSRISLLQLLHQRARQVGVKLVFSEIINPEDIESRFADSDIILACDGINSRIRDYYKESFKPEMSFMRNKFTWMGSTKPLKDFTYFFKETAHGVITAHTYQYEANGSTWVIETTPECWAGHGFDTMSEEESARYLEGVFAEELYGHGLIINRSLWRNFPKIYCHGWWHKNIVILGDAKASAHFSIGSGTKLAMECAIALADAVLEHGERSVDDAFKAYLAARETPVQVIQHNAEVSLAWFEHVARSWDMKPMQFAMVVMSRAKSITYDNLILRDAKFVEAVDTEFYQTYFEQTGIDCRKTRPTPMFTPLKLRELEIPNRVVVSPMAQYSAVDGVPNDWHFVHYTSRAIGGAGLVYVEMTCPSPEARITIGCTGLWNDEQESAWKRIVDFAHANSATKLCMQLGHSGRKGSTQLGWEKMDYPINQPDRNWDLYSASPIPYFAGTSQVPHELDQAGMDQIKADFVQATQRSHRAGFDMIELHCAHGYLFASFLSPLTNIRTDDFGGSIENRMRFPLDVFRAMRAAWPQEKPMAIRISATDWKNGGISEEDVLTLAKAFADAGCDLIDVSSGQTVADQKPVYGRMYQVPFAEAIKNITGLKTMCVGAITEPGQVNTIIACRRADLVALARPHLVNPYFTQHAAAWYGTRLSSWQKQYVSGMSQLYRESEKTREKQIELQRKAKPKRHHTERTLMMRAAE